MSSSVWIQIIIKDQISCYRTVVNEWCQLPLDSDRLCLLIDDQV